MLMLRRKRAGFRVLGGSRRGGRRSAVAAVLVLLVIIMIIIAVALARMTPIVETLSKSKARDVVLHAITIAVEDEVAGGSLDYSDLVTLEKDAAGNITALISNMAMINTLQMRIADGIVANVATLSEGKMTIPVGNVVGGILFASRGPGIPIKIQSVTNVYTSFENSFSSAGINQTQHRITLAVSAEIDILIPGRSTKSVVETEVLIAETIIVGVVPNMYVGE